MTVQTAKQVIACLEKFNAHFRTLERFISEKKAKVIADDLAWLLDSLVEEQRLVAEGNNLETRRLKLFEELGIADKKATALIEECPEEYRSRLRLECASLERHIDFIKQANADIIEIIERKLTIQEKMSNAPVTSVNTYTGKGVKVRQQSGAGGIIGEV
ncbi:MAG: flagellar protein FlgN [Bacteroides sp.]|nr:flagellar protein FlgN [Eubacterium sp.]MCM1418538.1 flagellar protein FlgN [Roseburia sp.]MCM1462580.1 flagellar protein FlgN [Bacteroides sp.]